MSHEETFARDLVTDDALETRLLRLVTALAADLRAEGLSTGCVTVKIRDHDFKTRQAGRTLTKALRTDRALYAVARELLGGLRARRRTASRLLGVSFSHLRTGDVPAQLTLLAESAAEGETPRDRRLATAVDNINEKLGGKSIGPARLMKGKDPRLPQIK